MFGLSPIEVLLIFGAIFLLCRRGWRPPAPARLGKARDLGRSPVPIERAKFVAMVAIEVVLLAVVLYGRFIR